ncbi:MULTISPECIES: ABC transporter substrate-binding protein [Mycobacteriaceae]|uniref:ABC transporter substrate-binding protein n=1 Tax=Mycobacteriaceae TaxID=1762 RepID=UPI00080002D5|nr:MULTISPECIES: ABC transporter substrate-binding protein [Mycobacteriaceae]MCK0176293.1 ABC transporter substrate-binding protein [Mycolicibacterium sp. F2034L]OBB61737.1 amino acid ABC transporter [Mycobacterium sp. 852013-51886_SCH5428379]
MLGRRSTLGVIACAAMVASTACSGGSGGGDTIKFGWLNGITGDYSSYYEPSQAAVTIAIDEINQDGGVLGKKVELVTADNLSTVEGAVQGFSRLVDVENVVAVGGVESTGGLAILDSANELEIPVFCPGCGTPELDTGAGDYMFRITGSDSDGGTIAAQFARDQGVKRVAVMAQNTEGMSEPADIFTKVFEGSGGEVVANVRFNPGRSSYQAELAQAFDKKPDAVYLAAGHEAASVIFREWQRRGYGGKFFVSPDLVTPPIGSLMPELENGVAIGAIAAYDTDSPAYKSFAERFKAKTGQEPAAGVYDANQYDEYIALALAITKAQSTEGAAIAAAIPEVLNPGGKEVYSYAEGLKELEAGNEINYHGASGTLDLNENNNLAAPLFGEQFIIDGAWQQVEVIELDPALRSLVSG